MYKSSLFVGCCVWGHVSRDERIVFRSESRLSSSLYVPLSFRPLATKSFSPRLLFRSLSGEDSRLFSCSLRFASASVVDVWSCCFRRTPNPICERVFVFLFVYCFAWILSFIVLLALGIFVEWDHQFELGRL